MPAVEVQASKTGERAVQKFGVEKGKGGLAEALGRAAGIGRAGGWEVQRGQKGLGSFSRFFSARSFAAQHVKLPPSSVAHGEPPVYTTKEVGRLHTTPFCPSPSAHHPAMRPAYRPAYPCPAMPVISI